MRKILVPAVALVALFGCAHPTPPEGFGTTTANAPPPTNAGAATGDQAQVCSQAKTLSASQVALIKARRPRPKRRSAPAIRPPWPVRQRPQGRRVELGRPTQPVVRQADHAAAEDGADRRRVDHHRARRLDRAAAGRAEQAGRLHQQARRRLPLTPRTLCLARRNASERARRTRRSSG